MPPAAGPWATVRSRKSKRLTGRDILWRFGRGNINPTLDEKGLPGSGEPTEPPGAKPAGQNMNRQIVRVSEQMAENHHIDYVELPAHDLDKVRQFYRDVFGWAFVDYGPDYTAFSNSGLLGGFFRAEQCSRTDNGAALVVLYATDLEQTQARVTEHGGTIVKPIFAFPGGRRFQFLDPAGNELAVWTHAEADDS